MDFRFFVLLLTIASALICESASGSSPYTRLWRKLLEDYDKRVRPVHEPDDVLNISMSLHLDNVIDLAWYDQYLKFDAKLYGRKSVVGYIKDVWVPDMMLYESTYEENPGRIDQHPFLNVFHDGLVKWYPAMVSSTACKFHVSDYPFDTQVCPLSFGSWMHPNSDVHLIWNEPKDKGDFFITSGEWNVRSLECSVKEEEFDNVTYDGLRCHLTLARRPFHYIFNLGIPCFLLLVVGSFTFLLPVKCEEKVSLSLTILLALTVFMEVLMDHLPPNSDGIPLLGRFITACMALLAISTMMAVSVVYMVSRSKGKTKCAPPPYWMEVLVLHWLAKLVCCPQRNKTVRNISSQQNMELTTISSEVSQRDHNDDRKAAGNIHEDRKQLWIDIATVMDRIYFLIYLAAVFLLVFIFTTF